MKKAFSYILSILSILSCSVKEERIDCPCYFHMLTESGLDLSKDDTFLLSVYNAGNSLEYRREFTNQEVRFDTYDDIRVRKGIMDASAVWGIEKATVIYQVVRIQDGDQCDSLYACMQKGIDATGEDAYFTINNLKQFATVSVTMVGAGKGSDYPYDLAVTGGVCGFDLLTLDSVEGPYRYPVPEMKDSTFSVRVPRQKADNPLALEFREKGSSKLIDSLNLGSLIAEMGYDWTKKQLDDVSVVIDYSLSRTGIKIGDWELVWIPDEEI